MWLVPSSEGNAASRLGLTLDLWCKLNISSLIKLLHLLGCLICVKNIMIIVVLLKMMRDGNGGGEGGGGGGGGGGGLE